MLSEGPEKRRMLPEELLEAPTNPCRDDKFRIWFAELPTGVLSQLIVIDKKPIQIQQSLRRYSKKTNL